MISIQTVANSTLQYGYGKVVTYSLYCPYKWHEHIKSMFDVVTIQNVDKLSYKDMLENVIKEKWQGRDYTAKIMSDNNSNEIKNSCLVKYSCTMFGNKHIDNSDDSKLNDFIYLVNMLQDIENSYKGKVLNEFDWHLPYLKKDELNLRIDLQKKICAINCAIGDYRNYNFGSVEKWFKVLKDRNNNACKHVVRINEDGVLECCA